MQNLNVLANLCNGASGIKSYVVTFLEDRFSHVKTHILMEFILSKLSIHGYNNDNIPSNHDPGVRI